MLKLQIIIFLGISILFIFIRKELEKLPLDIQRKYRKKHDTIRTDSFYKGVRYLYTALYKF